MNVHELEHTEANLQRERMRKGLFWPVPKTLPPKPSGRKADKYIIIKPKQAMEPGLMQSCRGLCAEILRKYASTPSTQTKFVLSSFIVDNHGFDLVFDL